MAKLYIVDDGPLRAKLQEKARRLGLDGAVIFLGKIKHQEVLERIFAADIFSLISSYEGFSHLLLESLSVGTPIVTTSVGGNIEIIKDGQNGLLAPVGDSIKTAEMIIKLLNDDNLRNMLAEQGKKDVAAFSEEIMLKEISAILR